MKRNIKKMIVGVSLASMLLAGCQKKEECDICGEKAVCETKTILGKEEKICDECKADAEDMFNLFQ